MAKTDLTGVINNYEKSLTLAGGEERPRLAWKMPLGPLRADGSKLASYLVAERIITQQTELD